MSVTLKITAIAGAAVLALGAATAQESTTTTAPAYTADASNDRPLFANPFDASTWWDGAGEMNHAEMGKPEQFNMAHPSFWLSFMDPETHTKRHMQFTNPATYAQFMDPAVYMEFAKPTNWLAWFDLKNYESLVEVETYTYWMQPGAYTHAIKPDGYMQSLDLANYEAYITPGTYLKFMDPSSYDLSEAAEDASDAMELLNPANVFSYMTSMLDQ